MVCITYCSKLPPIRDDSSLLAISLGIRANQSKALGPKRLQTRPTSNLQTPSFLPQTPALFNPSSGQCSSNVQPPPSRGARLPALLLSLSALSPLPSSAVRDSYGLIRPSLPRTPTQLALCISNQPFVNYSIKSPANMRILQPTPTSGLLSREARS
jgi:hypothetical protein